MTELLDRIPDWYWDVPYVAASFPGAVGRDQLRHGGNCQLFAYEIVRELGFVIGDLRSDALWNDREYTTVADRLQPLDLVLFNRSPEPWGAHVGVCVDASRVLHLCAEVGRPAVWTTSDFQARPRYAVLVGGKRPIRAA